MEYYDQSSEGRENILSRKKNTIFKVCHFAKIAVTVSIAPFWLNRPSTTVASELIGCTLVRKFSDELLVRGLIVETEAYALDDPAMHAYRRKTARNQVLFGAAGRRYVYQVYGVYHCLNIVTDQESVPRQY